MTLKYTKTCDISHLYVFSIKVAKITLCNFGMHVVNNVKWCIIQDVLQLIFSPKITGKKKIIRDWEITLLRLMQKK